MTRRDYLLTQLIEECAEIQKTACNCLKYGENDVNRQSMASKMTFLEDLSNKINDLEAIIGLLGVEKDVKKQQQKCCRIEYWLNYCKEKGRIEDVH